VILALQDLSWGLVIFACLTLGLAPFSPPHIVEKLAMLRDGVTDEVRHDHAHNR
jgi:hypothetical protein